MQLNCTERAIYSFKSLYRKEERSQISNLSFHLMGPESKEQTKFIVSKKETKITVESIK